jgi:hypothetical protein
MAGTQINDDWKHWIRTNVERGCSKDVIFRILVDEGFDTGAVEAALEHRPDVDLSRIENPLKPVTDAQRLKNRLDKRNWILDTQRRMNRLRPAEVPRLHRLPAEAFLNDFYSAGRPVIITGMLDDWPAMTRWSLDYFARRFGEREVEVQFGRNADPQYEINSPKHRRTMRFAEYVELVRRAEVTNDFYMTANNDGKNHDALAGLWDDIVMIPEYLSPAPGGGGFFWFGPRGTVTPLHHDLTNNFMAQVVGRKRVLMVPACETDFLYNHEHCHTQVDALNVDWERFPRAREVQMLDCTIGPGDLLFIPVCCWHWVGGLDVSVTVTFTNFRWDNDFTRNYPAQTAF